MENNLECKNIIKRVRKSNHDLLPDIHWYGCKEESLHQFYDRECHELCEFGLCPLK